MKQTLFEWAKSQGSRLQKLQLIHESENEKELNREVICIETIETDSEICFIPFQMLLSETVALESVFGKRIQSLAHLECFSSYPHAIEIITMAVFMIYELKVESNSFWLPYLESLPKSYMLPICWPETVVDVLLYGTNLHFSTKHRINWLKNVHESVSGVVYDLFKRNIELEELLWAYASITSRAFPKARQSLEKQESSLETDWISISEICMYPVLDMLNHKRGCQIEWLMDRTGVTFVAREPFQKGQCVYNNYGPKGNENLLANYGFVLSSNPEDYVKILLAIRPQDPLLKKRKMLLDQLGLEKYHMLFLDDKVVSPKLLLTTKVIVANNDELDFISKDIKYSCNRLEMLALQTLWLLCKQKWNDIVQCQFHDHDCKDIEKELVELSKVYRNGQEMILRQYLRLFEETAKSLIQTSIPFHVDHVLLDVDFMKMATSSFYKLTGQVMEEDTLLCIALIHESQCKNSPWYDILCNFPRDNIETLLGHELDQVLDYFECVIEPIVEADPNTFSPTKFTKTETLWSNWYVNQYGIMFQSEFLKAIDQPVDENTLMIFPHEP